MLAVVLKVIVGGPVLYRAQRMGRDGRVFTMYKFRTMTPEPGAGPDRVACQDDPRITAVGRWLRRWRLDELPQIANVVRGEMSVVGPRPEGPRYVARYTKEQRKVLSVAPGITGLAQLYFLDESSLISEVVESGMDLDEAYVQTILPRKLALDLWYVEHWRWRLDVQILIRTVLRLVPAAGFLPSPKPLVPTSVLDRVQAPLSHLPDTIRDPTFRDQPSLS